jgi:NADPH:quinone reductase-like Zn-dependent oxidoreductase
MLAVAIERYGGPEELALMELSSPEPRDGDVLVRVDAAGVGLWDAKVRRGEAGRDHEFPLILGWEAAGSVERVGPGVSTLRPGDRVFTYAFGRGAYAELVAAPAEQTALAPERADAAVAAALPICGITAHQAITEDLDVRAGERVLITAGAGGTGALAIQLAAARGAEVIATASARNRGFCESLGAAHVIDYTRENVEDAVRSRYREGVDALLECVGGENFDRSIRAVRRGGRAVGLVDEPPGGTPDGVRVTAISGRPSASRLAELARLYDAGELRLEVQETYPLAAAARAHAAVEAGHVRGKLVLTVGGA